MDRISNSRWFSIVDAMSLYFVCDDCGYKLTGSRQNRGAKCPGCDNGMLRFTKQTGMFLAKKWAEFKKEKEQCLSDQQY